ncbi:SagB/ThcOx family dehydrogenase [Solihabitans fulvus]|uniref:SagB/ThcOx family dehydrogenase n=1 Tax=Solihabitans fulvus TaxID=1892852 RepID=A0A5B2XJ25_9PSEU|nr:SagB family peptide dehydrogenase [Solihabitans fulvus]KAA2263266.1 SagB/ThcOx family dehydrogenase [Solihabitans fulvus]
MRVKVAEHATLFYDRGSLVWDDYLHHRQYRISETAELLCRKFSQFTEIDELLAPLADPERVAVRGVVDELLAAGVLVVEGSTEHRTERALLAAWSSWGAGARHFHFASRTLSDDDYQDADEHDAALDSKLVDFPPPSPFARRGVAEVGLPELGAAPDWGDRGLFEVLLDRRTTREFGAEPLGVVELAHLLAILGGASPTRQRIGRTGTVFKTTPSGGGRHPIELYVHATRVDGLDPGWYHYDGRNHVLEPLGAVWGRAELARGAGDQDWIGEAAAVITYTGLLERTRWRYDTPRAYRVVQLDVGHLSQTAYLVATAMGLGVGFTAALRDELVERALGCDPTEEVVLGMTAIGPLPL